MQSGPARRSVSHSRSRLPGARGAPRGGDGVLLYTDGLVEARGGGSRYGTNRLSDALRHGKRLAPA